MIRRLNSQQKVKTLLQRGALPIILKINCIELKNFSFVFLEIVGYHFFAITPRSTLSCYYRLGSYLWV